MAELVVCSRPVPIDAMQHIDVFMWQLHQISPNPTLHILSQQLSALAESRNMLQR